MSPSMRTKSGREALRGAEVNTFDLIFEVLTPEQWAVWLKAPLECAAAKGNRDLAQRLVRAGAEMGYALRCAVRGGHRDVANDLLGSGASLVAKDEHGCNPLHVAAECGETEMVQLLLLKGADKDALDNDKCTPLSLAAWKGHLATALALLAAGADASLRCGEDSSPAMHVAAGEGYVDIVRAVIEHGADVDAADKYQRTALHIAACSNKAGAIDVLVEAGANIEARTVSGMTPLHATCFNVSREASLCLLKHGATVNPQDDNLVTPLTAVADMAGSQGAAEVVDALLRAGADETIADMFGNKAADMIGKDVEEADRLAEDVERVRELLANAPADRAWRRRGYLVLCRAHPDRVQQHSQASSDTTHHTNVARRTAAVQSWQTQGESRGAARWVISPVPTGPLWRRRCFWCRRRAYSGPSWGTREAGATNICSGIGSRTITQMPTP